MDPAGASAFALTMAALAGAGLGIAAGLVPGVHVNTLALLVMAGSGWLLTAGASPLALATALMAATAAQAVTSGVPSAFLGAPDPEAVASALPGHRLLHEGRGVEAADLHATGVLAGLAVALLLAVPLHAAIAPVFDTLGEAMPLLVLAACLVFVLSERRRIPYRRVLVAERVSTDSEGMVEGTVHAIEGGTLQLSTGSGSVTVHADPEATASLQAGDRVAVDGEWLQVDGPAGRALGILAAAGVFLLSGLVGVLCTRIPLASAVGLPPSPLFPALTGLFAFPALLLTIRPGSAPRRQVPVPATEALPEVARASAWGGLFGSLAGFLPGLSAAHAGVAALAVTRDGKPETTLLVLGAASGAATGFALVTLHAWDRARNGALIAARGLAPIPEWAGALPPAAFWASAGALLLAAGLAYAAAMAAARGLAGASARVPEHHVSALVLAALLVMVLAFTGLAGLLIAAAATAVGFLPLVHGVRRSHCMGVILLPVLLGLWGVLP